MMNGDFSMDPLGATRGPNNPNGFLDIVNPLDGFVPFQCDGSRNPIPADSAGHQTGGTACDKIPANMFDAADLGMIRLYPQSTTPDLTTRTNFANVPVRRLDEGEFDVRVDHNFSSKDSVFARFSYDQATSFVPGGSPGFAEANAFASTQDILNHGRNVAISETHVFSDRSINQFNVGFNRIFNHIRSFGDGTCEAAKLGIQGADLNSKCPGAPVGVITQSTKDCMSCGLSSTLMNNYWALGDRGFAPFQGGTNVFSISDSFDMIRGKHHFRIGGQVRAQQMNVETNAFQDGFFINFGLTGDAAADLLLGELGGGIHDQTFFGATTGRRWKMFRPFIQDDWRVTNDLTVNLGLAWAIVTPITEAQNRQANFDFATGKFYVAGSSSLLPGCTICVHSDGRVGIQLDKTALEPRIGLAWKPFGSQTTAIRAGYAIYHDSSWNQGAQGLWENPPYFAETDNFSGLCPFGNATSPIPANCGIQRGFLPIFTAQPNPASFTGTIQSQNLDFKQGIVQQYNLNIEHQLPGNLVLTAGYAGSHSTHILVDGLNLNVSNPLACFPQTTDFSGNVIPNVLFDPNYHFGCGTNNTVYPNARYGPFTTVANINDVGSARYDSLQVKAETKSARHGLYALLGYTYSRTFDSGYADGLGTTPGATYWPLPGTVKADWALSQINLNNQFTASVIYDLPFGKGKTFGGGWSGPVNAAFGGWQVTVIEKVTSGFPLFVVNSLNGNFSGSGVNFFWNGNSLNRPDQIADPHKAGPVAANPDPLCQVLVSQNGHAPDRVGTLAAWFNPCAFAPAEPGELGNSNRAPLYGPDFVNTDLSLIKKFRLTERVALDFRTEFFNLFNHAQFFLPGSSLTSMQDLNALSSFGKVTQTAHDPRVIQFALKLNF